MYGVTIRPAQAKGASLLTLLTITIAVRRALALRYATLDSRPAEKDSHGVSAAELTAVSDRHRDHIKESTTKLRE